MILTKTCGFPSIFSGKSIQNAVVSYSNGGNYNGEWENGLADGNGIMNYSNGGTYDGQWKNGKREGKGRLIFNNKDKYQEWIL